MSVLISKDLVREPLYVICPVYNPFRWKSRFKHTERALKHFHDSGAVIVLVEVAFNRREAVFADSGLDGTPANCGILGSAPKFRHRYLQLRTKDELWLKENSINLAVGTLPYDWQQVAWIDGDVHFLRPNWIGETIQQLQHYSFVQLFSHARDLAPNYEMLPEDHPHADGVSFTYAHHTGQLIYEPDATKRPHHHHHHHHPPKPPPPYGSTRVWPGLAWAATRTAWDSVGGLQDHHIWGGGDWVTAWALCDTGQIGEPPTGPMMRTDLSANYKLLSTEWLDKARKHIRRNVGYVEGSVVHHFHGRKQARGYNDKHALLGQIGFDPLRHLKKDFQGLYQLHDDGSENFVRLRDGMRVIAKARNEDATEL